MRAEAVRYARSRLLHGRIAALWGLLVAARIVAGPLVPWIGLFSAALFLGLATAAFRLWDDLADLDHDRTAHPSRVLATSSELRPFGAAAAFGLLILGLMLVGDGLRLAVYSLLLVLLGLLYLSRSRGSLPRPLCASLVLAKYPVLVFLAGAEPSERAWLTEICLYAALLIYDWRDDPA